MITTSWLILHWTMRLGSTIFVDLFKSHNTFVMFLTHISFVICHFLFFNRFPNIAMVVLVSLIHLLELVLCISFVTSGRFPQLKYFYISTIHWWLMNHFVLFRHCNHGTILKPMQSWNVENIFIFLVFYLVEKRIFDWISVHWKCVFLPSISFVFFFYVFHPKNRYIPQLNSTEKWTDKMLYKMKNKMSNPWCPPSNWMETLG